MIAFTKIRPRLRRVNQHQIYVIHIQIHKRLRQRGLGIGIIFMLCEQFAGEENLFPRDAAGANACAHALLVAVILGGV